MTAPSDDTSRIHKRYTLTLFNPSSYYHSLIFVIGVVAAIGLLVHTVYLPNPVNYLLILPMIVVLFVTQYLDSKFTPKKEYSKSVHMSLFSNGLWFAVIGTGYLSSIVFQTEINSMYIVEGMFLFAAFRIGLFTTTLGLNVFRSWLICMLQPLSLFLVLIPYDQWGVILLDPFAILFGVIFMIIATTWSIHTDRSGRPGVESTHKMVQSYLMSVKGDHTSVETIMESHSKLSTVMTSQLRLYGNDGRSDFRLVLPDIHPGPYHPIGGSNIPYLMYKRLNSSAMIMHSISDHSLNLPSKTEVDNYLQSILTSSKSSQGATCTEPIMTQINKARVTGIRFGRTAVLLLSLSPHGMEDLPSHTRHDIESMAKNRKFEHVLTIDCHNAMGKEIDDADSKDILKAAKSTLDELITKKDYPLEFGYANSQDMNIHNSDLAMGGLGILCMKINGKKYFLGWADANNMENGLREHVVSKFEANNLRLLEICTSDTHYSWELKVRNRNGYYQFGIISTKDNVADWYLQLAKESTSNMVEAEFELLEKQSSVKIMGTFLLGSLSRAVDKSMKITKIYMSVTFGFYLFTTLPIF